MAGGIGFEPMTSRLQDDVTNLYSIEYQSEPIEQQAEIELESWPFGPRSTGFEPATDCVSDNYSTIELR